jgi:F0F1-type ATP synthase beta subunit
MDAPVEITDNGQIIAIRGGVVDIRFPGKVPRIHDLLKAGKIAIEVADLAGEGVVRAEVLQTGIKALDLLCPIERGGKTGLFEGAGVGKTVLTLIYMHHGGHGVQAPTTENLLPLAPGFLTDLTKQPWKSPTSFWM